ncbi:interleukin-6 receptor subunit alpha [Sphaeramia orbicularis]|uniref:Interleukin-6 receptor subunit alpha-like n=1 Tax=Sphaeramia orbicularis TaxID=375764 RepID=A0A672Z1B1_9TELE|nr:interleukin-6 receptor subunit alpha-like [Sphaeramia orbicularis]
MRVFLPLLCVLCVPQVRGVIDGTCPRKDPPPGVLALLPGSKLVLTCSGHVSVDGVKVNVAKNIPNSNTKVGSLATTPANSLGHATVSVRSDRHVTGNGVSHGYLTPPAETQAGHVTEEKQSLRFTESTSPNTQTVQSTSVSSPPSVKPDHEAEDMDYDDDYEEDEWEGVSRVTRGVKSKPEWKQNGRMVGKGAALTLDSVSLEDSGRYTCHHRGKVRFSVKVTVADPPENPHLNCYKTSPSRKIRCEWTPQKLLTKGTSCYLLLRKSLSDTFLPVPCSAQQSRCWCALDHNEDEMRTYHRAYLCVTGITGNATSDLLYFTPLEILKPDPPSNVSVQEVVGHNRTLIVTWEPPSSWKYQDRYYKLIYEIKYKPSNSTFFQRKLINDWHNIHSITDAMTEFENEIQVRTKEEYDGYWSEWSKPVYGSTWKAMKEDMNEDLLKTPFTDLDDDGSGEEDSPDNSVSETESSNTVSLHILWISTALTLVFLGILATYIFSHRNRFMSKLQSLNIISQFRDSSQTHPSAPAAPEGQALMTFAPPHNTEQPSNDVQEENGEENRMKQMTETMNFNNTSYFLVLRE